MRNKRGQIETSDIVATMFIFIILIFFIIYTFAGSLHTGEIESLIKANDKVKTYNYYPDLINFLNNEIILEDRDILMKELFEIYLESGEYSELVEEEVSGFLNEISYCYSDEGKLSKRGFVLGLSDKDQWTNMEFFSSWRLTTSYNSFFGNPYGFDGPIIYQRLNENDYVYFYVEDVKNILKGECEGL